MAVYLAFLLIPQAATGVTGSALLAVILLQQLKGPARKEYSPAKSMVAESIWRYGFVTMSILILRGMEFLLTSTEGCLSIVRLDALAVN